MLHCITKIGSFIVLLGAILRNNANDAQCNNANLCCPGQNSSCQILSNNCFCDFYCLQANDCCVDYEDYCLNQGAHTIASHIFILIGTCNLQRETKF